MAGPAPTTLQDNRDRSAGPVHSSGWLFARLAAVDRRFPLWSNRIDEPAHGEPRSEKSDQANYAANEDVIRPVTRRGVGHFKEGGRAEPNDADASKRCEHTDGSTDQPKSLCDTGRLRRLRVVESLTFIRQSALRANNVVPLSSRGGARATLDRK